MHQIRPAASLADSPGRTFKFNSQLLREIWPLREERNHVQNSATKPGTGQKINRIFNIPPWADLTYANYQEWERKAAITLHQQQQQ